jgi:serine/threonine protein kinase
VVPLKSLELEGTVGRYTLKRRLNSGSYSEVWLSTDRTSGKEYACKVTTRAKFESTPKLAEWTKREIQALQMLNHAYIIKLVEVSVSCAATFSKVL